MPLFGIKRDLSFMGIVGWCSEGIQNLAFESPAAIITRFCLRISHVEENALPRRIWKKKEVSEDSSS
jgi:hypothetical protein